MEIEMKIRIPAQTVKVDPESWALDYNIEVHEVRKDVKRYFMDYAQEWIDNRCLGLEDEQS